MFAGEVSGTGSDMRAHHSADRTESPIPGRGRRPRERRQARPRADVDPEAAVQHGVVVSRQATYGFVRSGRDRLFFHISDVDPACAGELGLDWEVTFRQGHDPVSGRPVAVEVAGRPPQPRAAPRDLGARAAQRGRPAKSGDACPPGFFRGVVHQVSRGPPTAKLDDGIILFADPEEGAPAEGLHHQAIYGTYSLQAGPETPPEEGDAVEFEVVFNPVTLSRKAINIRVVDRAGSAAPRTPPPETAPLPLPAGPCLGRVVSVKKEFGFIKQVHSVQDVFFHFSELAPELAREDVAPGLDVEYQVGRFRGSVAAFGVRRAPPGSVSFETVGEEVLEGVLVERPDQAGPGVLSYGGVPGEAGARAATPGRVLLFPGDCPRVPRGARPRAGDVLRFRVQTDLRAAAAAGRASTLAGAVMAGRRAVQVSFVQVAGRVASVAPDRGFGFVNKLRYPEAGAVPVPAGEAAGGAEDAEETPSVRGTPPTSVAMPPRLYFSLRDVNLGGGVQVDPRVAAAKEPRAEVDAKADGERSETEAVAGTSSETAPSTAPGTEAPPSASSSPAGAPAPLRMGDDVQGILHVSQRSSEPSLRQVVRTAVAPPAPEARPAAPRPRLVLNASAKRQEDTRRQPLGPPAPDVAGFELERTYEAVPLVPGFERTKRAPPPPPPADKAAARPNGKGRGNGKRGTPAPAPESESEPEMQRMASAAALDMAAALDAAEFVPGPSGEESSS